MSAQHTPGPWSVGSKTGHNANFVFGLESPICSVFDIAIHRHVSELTMRDAQGLANARLIAAAPELLEALEGAIGALEFSRDFHNDLGNEEQAYAQDKLDAATKAIAKARGQ